MERGYEMEDYQQRVIEEKKELDEKINKLRIFLGASPFKSLTVENQSLLKDQYVVMAQYSTILAKRIDLF